jgi:hypothetical protein
MLCLPHEYDEGERKRTSLYKTPGCFPEHIETQASKLFSDLKADNFLESLPAGEFATKAAHFLAELNAIQASREGMDALSCRFRPVG